MKKISLLFLLLASLFIAAQNQAKASTELIASNNSYQNIAEDTLVNLALTANVSTSFVSSWEKLSAVNDGFTPKKSSDKAKGAYGNWNGEGDYNKYNWVEYDWDLAQKIKSLSVYWWDDGGGIDQPTDAFIEYWDGNNWVNAGKIGTELNQFNILTADLWTNKVRINMVSAMATGILEFQVMGFKGEPCTPTPLIAYIAPNQSTLKEANYANVTIGNSVTLSPAINGTSIDGAWSWKGPKDFKASTSKITISNLQVDQSGTYTATFLNNCGASSSINFFITVSESTSGSTYSWSKYSPTLNYNFRNEFPALEEPTKDLDDCPSVVGSQSSGWWTFRWGAKANSLITEAAITPMLERMNKDFAYFRDIMGWPPDKRAKNGYRSAIYLFGSGLCTDNASNTDLGGWQSAIDYKGESWPMVLLSYYPVYSFDPECKYSDREAQMGACVHEGIHSVLADLPGCKNAAWFQEGGNTWLQQEAAATQSNDYSNMGFLNGTTFIAPFMPIECYSGWLQDDSFGGPSAEGVNKFDGGKQLCTWRTYLGGNQYGNAFPVFLGQTLGNGSIPWIWRHCESRVLEGMADSLGEVQTRRLIMEYRAKQAMLDMGKWTEAIRKLVNANFKKSIGAEWKPSWMNPEKWIATPYAKTTKDENGFLVPEYRTTPGWSGANQIPLHVEGDTVIVGFQPLGENMTCQLCYRTASGEVVYSQPVYGGECVLKLDKKPANGVVIAVICNTNYIYKGEETRKAHYDYRLQLVKGAKRTANIYLKWYNWTDIIADPETSDASSWNSSGLKSILYPNPVEAGEPINIEFTEKPKERVTVEIINPLGQQIYSKETNGNFSIATDSGYKPGIYIISLKSLTYKNSLKLAVR
jgi:hypothetical protein